MKFRKTVWIAALCLLSTLAIAVVLTGTARKVRAAKAPRPSQQSMLAQPAAYVSASALRAAFDADSILFGRVDASRIAFHNPMLPEVQEFTLTPPNPSLGMNETALSVRFSDPDASKLAEQIPITLDRQNVVLQRSAEDPSIFTTHIDFDWTAFLKQQQRRQELAQRGITVPIYKGREFLHRQQIQFVEPSEIQQALHSHSSVQFSPDAIVGGNVVTVIPDHELMIVDPSVVEDGHIEQQNGGSGRTYDACIPNTPGNPNGAWTFKTLWLAAINTSNMQAAEQALDDLLYNWNNPNLKINTFPVLTRPGIGSLQSPSANGTGFLANWPVDTSNLCTEPNGQTYCPSLNAPVRLNAIVNRVDLAGQPNQTAAGELRFVFGVSAGNAPGQSCFVENNGQQPSSGPPFNIIFEYHVPSGYTAAQWAQQWNMLPDNFGYSNCSGGQCYIPLLQSLITDNVVKNNSCGGSTCLFHIRTNEVLLTGSPAVWELREFGVNLGSGGSPNSISEIEVDQTPSDSFNFGGGACFRGGTNENGEPACTTNSTATAVYLNNNYTAIDSGLGVTPLIPQTVPPQSAFQGGSSLNAFENGPGTQAFSYWNVCAYGVDKNCNVRLDNISDAHNARRFFSANTCNGCHGDETNNTLFQHVFNRLPGQASSLSNFLLGCAPSGGQSACASGNPGGDSCSVASASQCLLNTPGQEQVPDPADAQNLPFNYGDIAARQIKMQTLLGGGNAPLLPLVRQPIGSH